MAPVASTRTDGTPSRSDKCKYNTPVMGTPTRIERSLLTQVQTGTGLR